jgi:hypothetical protein
VADEHGPLAAEIVEQAQEVVGQVDDVIVGDAVRPGRPAVAPLVGGHGVVTGGGQRGELVAP